MPPARHVWLTSGSEVYWIIQSAGEEGQGGAWEWVF